MPLPDDLTYFTAMEFRHPELMDGDFCHFLESVRSRYGAPLVLTSDARTPAENAAASGSAPTSLHLIGRAVDLRWISDRAARWAFMVAVVETARALGVFPELELVNGPTDQHIHLGLFVAPHAAALEVRAD
jgi:hypothetical protein